MKRTLRLFIVLLFVFSLSLTAVNAGTCVNDCLLQDKKLEPCLTECPTPVFKRCMAERQDVRACLSQHMPQAECLAQCITKTHNSTRCEQQCLGNVSAERCAQTCMLMCERAHCDGDGCEKDCEKLCGEECGTNVSTSPEEEPGPGFIEKVFGFFTQTTTDSKKAMERKAQLSERQNAPTVPETDHQVNETDAKKPTGGGGTPEKEAPSDNYETGNDSVDSAPLQESGASKDCFSICHKYCTLHCTEDCSGPECSEECYTNCSSKCRRECSGDAAEADEEDGEQHSGWTFEFWAMLGFFAVVLTSAGSWIASRTNRKEKLKIIDQIEQTYNTYKANRNVCIEKLNEIRQAVKDEYANHKIDETNFDFLIDRIEHYIYELRYEMLQDIHTNQNQQGSNTGAATGGNNGNTSTGQWNR